MQYWRLRVNLSKDGGYDVFYKTFIEVLPVNVAQHAVIDGDLLDVFMHHVDKIELISKEVYYEHMND